MRREHLWLKRITEPWAHLAVPTLDNSQTLLPRNPTPGGQLTLSLSSKVYNNSSRQSHRRLSPLLGKVERTRKRNPNTDYLLCPPEPSPRLAVPPRRGVTLGSTLPFSWQRGLACPGARCKEQTFPSTCVSVMYLSSLTKMQALWQQKLWFIDFFLPRTCCPTWLETK